MLTTNKFIFKNASTITTACCMHTVNIIRVIIVPFKNLKHLWRKTVSATSRTGYIYSVNFVWAALSVMRLMVPAYQCCKIYWHNNSYLYYCTIRSIIIQVGSSIFHSAFYLFYILNRRYYLITYIYCMLFIELLVFLFKLSRSQRYILLPFLDNIQVLLL